MNVMCGMKRVTLYNILLLFIILFPASAAAAETAAQILARCAAKVNSAESLDVRFTLSAEGSNSSYTMKISHEKFMMESPQIAVWYNGVTQWTYVKSNRELNITDPTAEELMECNPFSILNFYSKTYDIKRLAGNGIQIEMTAKDRSATVRKAVITIDSRTYMPSKVLVTLGNGHIMAATVTSVTQGKRPAAKTFTYDKARYPASEIIDLR